TMELLPDPQSRDAVVVAGVTAWMAIWWISEVVPIAATSLLPLAVFPLLGVSSTKAVALAYMNPFIVLLMAGFMAALALERWNLHKRLSLAVLSAVGASPSRLVLGMMLACAFSSMWISNTATTLMMLPIGMALVARAEAREGVSTVAVTGFATALYLGIAYGASVGGLATPIGTPPNLIFMGVYEESFPEADPITFASWVSMALPLVIVFLVAIWFYLTRIAHKVSDDLDMGSADILAEERRGLGVMTGDQKTVAAIFVGMALLWVTRRVRLGDGELAGWAPALGLDGLVNDATVAVAGAVLLFAWPSRSLPGERLLDWPTAKKIPWEVVLLFGGGVSLAGVFKVSGLSAAVAQGLTGLAGLPTVALVAIIALSVTFLTEVTSNTATTTILMPVLAAFSEATGISAELVMIPAVLSASCAFMLPVATAPNAIVFGTGRVTMATMARTGFALNLLGAVLVTLWVLVRY
ncbi:MAG: SLC13 family permease, partial [Myxococcota bacterium]|nr:SLC13 family permease [Myxococcota bacterium]